jgi:glutathione peroxidase
MSKTLVNGNSEDPLFTWLKGLCPLATSFNYGALTWTPIKPHDIGWNFEKILIDKDGRPCRRYSSEVPARNLAADIDMVLSSGCPWNPTSPECTASGARRL